MRIIVGPTRNVPRTLLDMLRIEYQQLLPPPLPVPPPLGVAQQRAKSNILGPALRRCVDTPPVDTKCGTARGEGRRCEWLAAGGTAWHPAERDAECADGAAAGGGGQTCTRRPQRSGQDVRPPRLKYDSPPSCRKKRWAEFTVQLLPSPSSSLEAAAAAAVPPLYSPQRSRGDCCCRCRGNHDAAPLPAATALTPSPC